MPKNPRLIGINLYDESIVDSLPYTYGAVPIQYCTVKALLTV